MDRIAGLPAHPLFVHVPIVLIPLLALIAVGFVIRPIWRQTLAVPLAVTAIVTLVGTVLAASSGESLRNQVDRNALVRQHAEMGDQMQAIGVLFSLSVLALVALYAFGRYQGGRYRFAGFKQFVLVAGVASILTGGFATVWDVRTGHSGAKAVWSEREQRYDETGQLVPPQPSSTSPSQ
jgi:hypothetical protein